MNEHAMTGIVGTWTLIASRAQSPEGKPLPAPFGPEAMGLLQLLPNGRMMAVLCDGRASMPGDARRSYVSYCGAYEFDGTTLVTKVDGSSDSPRFSVDQVRQVTIDGDRMTLQPPARMQAGELTIATITWERIRA